MEEATPASRRDPLDTPPPAFSLEEARAVAERVFGIAGSATPLGSERDQNLRLAADDGENFLLKISNPADQRGALEMQSLAMLHIAAVDPDLPVMRPQRSLDRSYHAEAEGPDGRTHIVRLFSFLPGRAVIAPELQTSELWAVGAAVARIGIALRGFFHPAGGYEILWDLKHTPRLRNLLEHVSDGPRREMAERVLGRFEQRVGPNLPSLRAQMIHNDLSLDNILLDESHQVSGIVDFGDLTHTALICDLAIALVSLMWDAPDPLDACRTAIEGYTSLMSIEEAEAEVLGDLIGARLVALGLIARWRVDQYPENADYITGNEERTWALLDYLDTLTWPQAGERIRSACLSETSARSSTRPPVGELIERRRRVLGPALSALTYDRPLYLVRAQGTRMYDEQGAAYLDAYNNVPVVGHCHPRVSAAIAQQSRTLNTNTRYLHESVVELAERLVATMPGGLDTVMFFNSGSEANDIAWRLATTYTGGTGAVVTAHAYHGVTTTTIAFSPEEWAAGQQPAHVETVPPPDGYRSGGGEPAGAIGMALDALTDRGMKPAAFFVDPLFTSDGIHTPPPTYLQKIIRALHQAGALLVADEVQCGFGRSGSHLWSFESSGITPDLVTLGKPMGNGHPIAAVVTRREIAERFAQQSDMFSTFGGNPVACRAALSVLDVIEEEHLRLRAHEVGLHLREGLAQLQERHPSIGDVRGTGLLVGVELVEEPTTQEPASRLAASVMETMRERGVLIGSTGPAANVLKIRPPLVLTHDDADLIVSALDAALNEPTLG
ncbi:MAG: aminotransferase class III-fold pyridoxal phosphate-dependent enzyme [Actinomycetota bacterium]